MRVPQAAPMRYLLLATAAWMTVLLLNHQDETGGHVLPVFGIRLLYDLGFLAYAALPLGLYLLLYPSALWRRRGHRGFLQARLTINQR